MTNEELIALNVRWQGVAVKADMLFEMLISDASVHPSRIKAIRKWQKEMDQLFQEDEA
jgi:hypothetical protein